VCLQETHSTSRDEFVSWVTSESAADNNRQQYSVLSSPGTVRSRGVAILYRPSLSVDHEVFDDQGRLQVVTFSICSSDSASFQLVNVYGPNRKAEGEHFFESIGSKFDASLQTVLCGDFNTVVDPDVDRFGCNPLSPWAYNWPRSLRQLTEEFDLRDALRMKHPDERNYTWRRVNGSQASRLDMFWVSSRLFESIAEVDIYPFFRSDHSYVFLRLTLPSLPQRGPGVWKFNASLLTLKLLNFWSRSHCISNSITSTIKKRKFFAASRESYIFYESLWDEDY
jgi:exonuclease III